MYLVSYVDLLFLLGQHTKSLLVKHVSITSNDKSKTCLKMGNSFDFKLDTNVAGARSINRKIKL